MDMGYARQATSIPTFANGLGRARSHRLFAFKPWHRTSTTEPRARALRYTAAAAGWILIAFGAAVAAMWLSRSSWSGPLAADLFQQKFNTAIALIVSGVGLIAALKESKTVALAAGGLLLVAAGGTLVEYATGLDLGIDQVLLADFHVPDSLYPGRMSSGTSLLFLFAGAWFLLFASGRLQPLGRSAVIELLSFLVFALGVGGLAWLLMNVTVAFTWGSPATMAYSTASAFAVLGAGMMALTWSKHDAPVASVSVWIPAILCLLVLVFDIATPLAVAVGIAYVPLVFCGAWFHRPHVVFVFAAVGTALTGFGLLVSEPSSTEFWAVLTNRLLSVGVLWLTALLVYQRRTAESAALHAGEKARSLANIVESSSEAIASRSLDGIIRSWNAGSERLFGYTAAEMIGRQAALLIPDALLSEDEAIVEQFKQGKTVAPYETVRLRKDGTPVDVSLTLSALRDATGQLVGISKIARDISERKWAEERFRLAIEAAPTAILAVNGNGDIVLVNAQTEMLFGYPRAELLGQALEILMPERFRGNHPRHRGSYFAKPQSRAMGAGRELFGLRKDGSEVPIEIGLSPMRTGQDLLILSTIVDISARKKYDNALRSANEALERSNIDLQRFAYVASHDLQTPMRSISSFVGLLRSTYADKLDAQAIDWIDRTERSIGYLQTLTRDLLNYSHVDSEARPFQPVAMSGVFDNAVQLLDASVRESNAEVLCGDLPTVNGDRPQLVQLVQNLIGNAIKYRAKDAPPRIHLSAELVKDEWVFALRDNGIGIATKHQKKIFEIFKRLHDQTEYPGTGIGLAVCRRVVHRHGGKIWVEAAPGNGSVFYFSIRERTD